MRFRRRGQRLLLLTSTVGIAATALAAGGAATAGAAGHVSTLKLRGSTPTFPVGHAPSGSGGALSLSEDGKLVHYGTISKSNRPTTRTVRGKTVATAGTTTGWIPNVAATPVHSTHPTMLNSWEGLNEYDNQTIAGFNLEPPDQGLCAGNGYVFEQINDVVQVYNTGGAPASAPLYLNTFFGLPDYQFTTDPSCVYDAGLNRWFVAELTLDVDPETGQLTGTDHIDIAVSKTGNPTGGYWYYSIPATDTGGANGPRHKDCPCIGDYPHIGTDAHGFFVTTNEYPFSGGGRYGNNFNGAQIYALSKKDMANGGATPLVHFSGPEITAANGDRLPAFTVWPALNPGTQYPTANHGSEYFTSSLAAEEARPNDFSGHAHRIGFWQMANTASLDTNDPAVYLRRWALDSENYGVPPISQQKSGPTPLRQCLAVQCRGDGNPYQTDSEGGLDSSDSRMLTGWFVNGHVVTALDTAMSVGGNLLGGPAWFDIDPGAGSPAIANQGYLGVANNNVTYPAIATDPSGNGAMGLTLVGDDHYPSAAYTLWGPTGPGDVNTAAEGQAPEDGFCEYTFYNCANTPQPAPRPRWGDYGAAAWDGRNLWVANEYIAHSCTFAQFDSDTTCGGTRTYYGNFSTRISKLAAGG